MASIIVDDVAEGAIAEITGVDVELHFHTGDPGAAGTANVATGLAAKVILSTDWAAAVDDTATTARGGRVLTNTAEIALGTTDAAETVTHVTVWEETTPASGTYDVLQMVIELAASLTYGSGDDVVIEAAALEIFAAGAA